MQGIWEELNIGSNMLPISIALVPVVDYEIIKIIESMLTCCLGHCVHTLQINISNSIIPIDKLMVRFSTPMEISSFVQQSKIIFYIPKRFVTTGYKLFNKDGIVFIKYNKLVGINKMRQMIRIICKDGFVTVNIYGIVSVCVCVCACVCA